MFSDSEKVFSMVGGLVARF